MRREPDPAGGARRPRSPTPDASAGRRPSGAWVALAVVAASWLALRAAPAGWIDGAWALGWLPAASRRSAALIDALPWSLTLGSAVVLLAALLWWILARGRRRSRWPWVLVAVLALGPAFELAWGLGYRRSPLEARLGLPADAPAAADVWAALEALHEVVLAEAPTDLARVALDAPWWDSALAAGVDCVARVDAFVSGREEPLRLPTRVRPLPAGTFLRAGFAGLQAPWWREPHLDAGLPPAAALATGLHELAHAAGWAREAETDALSVLAGLSCADPDVRFATALHGLALVRAELARLPHADPGWRERLDELWATLPPAATAAWSASSAAIARHRSPPIERVTRATYDAYLRAQGVSAGMADYGRAGVVLVAVLAGCETDPAAPWCSP